MPADGGEPVRLTDLQHGVASRRGHRTARRLAFVSRVGGWEEPKDEEERSASKPARVITSLKYKSNGEGFVYDRPQHVFVVSADGGPAAPAHRRRLRRRDPAWSPDGRGSPSPPPGTPSATTTTRPTSGACPRRAARRGG